MEFFCIENKQQDQTNKLNQYVISIPSYEITKHWIFKEATTSKNQKIFLLCKIFFFANFSWHTTSIKAHIARLKNVRMKRHRLCQAHTINSMPFIKNLHTKQKIKNIMYAKNMQHFRIIKRIRPTMSSVLTTCIS